jgi:hypothetical protein
VALKAMHAAKDTLKLVLKPQASRRRAPSHCDRTPRSRGGRRGLRSARWRSGNCPGSCSRPIFDTPGVSFAEGLSMRSPLARSLATLSVGVILLQRSGVCWAEEATARGITGTLYVGAGDAGLSSNEGTPTRYDERHVGAGVLVVLRPWANPKQELREKAGGFVHLGATGELRALRLAECGYACPQDAQSGSFVQEPHFGARAGIGYDFALFGLRGGALLSVSPEARLAETIVMPDVQLRLGYLDQGWFEAGLGAYDASTTLRPGLYIGGGVPLRDFVLLSLHLGLHAGNGRFVGQVFDMGLRGDVGLEFELGARVRLGVGGNLQSTAVGTLLEARTQLGVAL